MMSLETEGSDYGYFSREVGFYEVVVYNSRRPKNQYFGCHQKLYWTDTITFFHWINERKLIC